MKFSIVISQDASVPSPKVLLQLSDTPSTSSAVKRKANVDDSSDMKRSKVDESTSTKEIQANATAADGCVGGSVVLEQDDKTEESESEILSKTSQPKPASNLTKHFIDSIIDHGTAMDVDFLPQSK